MSTLSNDRAHPRTGAIAWRVMDTEQWTVQELDNYPGLYGYQLQDRPRQGTVTVVEDITGGATFTQVTTDPLPGQCFVDYDAGFILFNVADNGTTTLNDYEGGGSNANLLNLGSLIAFDVSFLELNDTPDSYAGFAGYSVKVNLAETGLEFTTDNTGILTLNGDTGSATGSVVTITGGSGLITSASGSTVTLNVDLKANSGLVFDTNQLAVTLKANSGLVFDTGQIAVTLKANSGLIFDTGQIAVTLKTNGGIVFESGALAVDLGASSITGFLSVSDGGTGATSLTSNAILTGNGTSAIQAETTLTYTDAGNTGTLQNSSVDFFNITTPIDSVSEFYITTGESTGGTSARVLIFSGQGVTGSGDVLFLSGDVVGNGNTGAVENRSGSLTGDGNTGNIVNRSGGANGDNVTTGNTLFGSGAFVATTSGASGSTEVFSGDGNGPGDSGQVLIYSGQVNTGNSGAVFLRSGATTGTSVLSGAVRVSSGNAGGGTNSSSGSILLTTGTKSGTGERGIIDLSARYIRAAAPWVTRNAGGTAQADAFQELPSVINSFQTAEIDLKTTGTYTFTVPTGFRFYPDEVRVFITSVSGLTVNATFRAGISGTPAKFVAATLMTAATQFARTRYDSLTADGETNFQVEITTGATATTFNGRFIFIGQLIEVE